MARQFSRRQVLRYGAGAAIAAGAGSAPRSCSSDPSKAPTNGAQQGLPIRQPQVLRRADGELAVSLRATTASVDLNAPKAARTYTFNGTVPGQTWELEPGDVLRVDLINDLPELPPNPNPDMTRPHKWTTTNLHTHGLHVSPQGNGDNVFLTIPPGGRQRYEIAVPSDHPSGLFWYHPHRHGAVTQQVRAGMAGAIIVRGDIDEVPEVRAAAEQVMVLQAIELGDDYQLLDPIPHPSKDEAFFPRSQILYTVNGVLRPRITMHPGEVQRWRLVNAAEGKYMSLRLADHDLHVLAWDGLTLAEPENTEVALLSSGNRADVLVKAGSPGTYDLVLTPGSSQEPDIPGMPDAPSTSPSPRPTSSELVPRPIATVEVTGRGPDMDVPTSLPAWDPPILPIARKRRFEFTVTRTSEDEFVDFGVDGVPFDPDRAPYRVRLGTAEEWTLVNGVDTKLPAHAHVFHIHQNPFKITKINGKPLDKPLWRDTFVLTKHSGDSITFVSNFVDFAGKFVEHCHVLSHEDLGMMEAIEIVP